MANWKKYVKRYLLILLFGLGITLFMLWQNAHAYAPVFGFDAQNQVDQIVPSLVSSEAEHASGAYIPGVGAVFIMDLLRGPNSVKNRMPAYGVRDWAIYLMQTFGPQLNKVPPTESVSFSIEYFDYSSLTYHQFVMTSKQADVADPGKYTLWLDGKPFSQAVPPEPTNTPSAAKTVNPVKMTPTAPVIPAGPIQTPAPSKPGGPTVLPPTGSGSAPTPSAGGATAAPSQSGQPPTTPQAGPTAPISITSPTAIAINLTDTKTSADWKVLNGQWAIDSTGYTQNQLGLFDLITLYTRSISGNYNFQVDVKFLSGQMGGGLVFNAPRSDSKNGAQMISYAGSGKYLQWGYFDDNGVFQFQAGTPVPNGADGKNHRLQVQVRGSVYTVLLDGAALGKNVPLSHPNGGFVGLLASTSQVVFNNANLEQIGQ